MRSGTGSAYRSRRESTPFSQGTQAALSGADTKEPEIVDEPETVGSAPDLFGRQLLGGQQRVDGLPALLRLGVGAGEVDQVVGSSLPRQPVALRPGILNPAIVVAAVSAWERLIADLVGAVTPVSEEFSADPSTRRLFPGSAPDQSAGGTQQMVLGWPAGTYVNTNGSHAPSQVGSRLRNLGYLASPDLVHRWKADVPTSWRGVQPTRWRRLGPGTDQEWGVDDYVSAAILVRNAGAHRSADVLEWNCQKKPVPFLDSDAESTTIQHGHARGILALMIQVVAFTIDAICTDQGWPSTGHRLPAFLGVPQPRGRYQGIDFWSHELQQAPR